MAQTSIFTVDAAGNPESYIVKTICKRITVYEDAQAGTTDYKVYVPPNSATPVTKPAGSKYVQERQDRQGWFMPGDTPFAVATVSGSVTFAAEEE
jgi:hypothetical protein